MDRNYEMQKFMLQQAEQRREFMENMRYQERQATQQQQAQAQQMQGQPQQPPQV